MDFGPAIPPPGEKNEKKKKRRLNAIPIEFLQNLPSGVMYEKSYMPVSYTHLTLPTILRV